MNRHTRERQWLQRYERTERDAQQVGDRAARRVTAMTSLVSVLAIYWVLGPVCALLFGMGALCWLGGEAARFLIRWQIMDTFHRHEAEDLKHLDAQMRSLEDAMRISEEEGFRG